MEVVIIQTACLGEVVDEVAYLNVDQPIFGLFVESILFDNVLGEVYKFHTHVFGMLEEAAKVKILDVRTHVFRIISAEDTIPKDLRPG